MTTTVMIRQMTSRSGFEATAVQDLGNEERRIDESANYIDAEDDDAA